MVNQRRSPGCGSALIAGLVMGSFIIAIYGGELNFAFVLLVAFVGTVGYGLYRLVRRP